MSASAVAYDPNDTTQQSFLAALALGETGGNAHAYTEGYGGVDLSGAATDQYGFPTWGGSGNTHAAGAYQFQPGTWDKIASSLGLNFSNPSDQNAGAWQYAQQTYAAQTGGDLETALKSGDYSSVQKALAGVWPSVNGNSANPQGLAYDISNHIGASGIDNSGSAAANAATGSSGSGASSTAGATDFLGEIEGFFVRFGLIIAGGLIILVALWKLLSDNGVMPSPASTVKHVGGALALAA